MSDNLNQYTLDLENRIHKFKPKYSIKNVGKVIEAGDGIARVTGLTDVRSQELVEFENGIKGIAFNLEKTRLASSLWVIIQRSPKICRFKQRVGSLRSRLVQRW